MSFMQFTCGVISSPLGPDFGKDGSEVTQYLAQELEKVWEDFEARLDDVPLIRHVEEGTVTINNYRELLLDLPPAGCRRRPIDGFWPRPRCRSSCSRSARC